MRKPLTFFRTSALIAIASALIAGALLYWQGTASYALRDLERSVRERDLATFYTRVDLNRVVDSLIDAAATRGVSHAPGDEWKNFQERFRAEFSKLLKSQAVVQIKRDIEKSFSAAAPPSADNVDSALGQLADIRRFLLRVDHWTLGSPSTSGAEARSNLIVHIPRLDKRYPLVLVLRKDEGDIWKAVALEGVATVMDLFDKDKAAYVAASNQATRDEMARILPMSPVEIRKDEGWFWRKDFYFSLRFRNESDFPVRSFRGRILVQDGLGKILTSYPFAVPETDLLPRTEKTFAITPSVKVFDEKAKAAFAAKDLKVNFSYEEISFRGRSALRMISSLEEEEIDKGD